jgi:hypothetical protein
MFAKKHIIPSLPFPSPSPVPCSAINYLHDFKSRCVVKIDALSKKIQSSVMLEFPPDAYRTLGSHAIFDVPEVIHF